MRWNTAESFTFGVIHLPCKLFLLIFRKSTKYNRKKVLDIYIFKGLQRDTKQHCVFSLRRLDYQPFYNKTPEFYISTLKMPVRRWYIYHCYYLKPIDYIFARPCLILQNDNSQEIVCNIKIWKFIYCKSDKERHILYSITYLWTLKVNGIETS